MTREATIESTVLPTVQEVQFVSTLLVTKDNAELYEDIGGGIATLGSLRDEEHHLSAILLVSEILKEERVVSTLMVTEKSPLADNKDVAVSVDNKNLMALYKLLVCRLTIFDYASI